MMFLPALLALTGRLHALRIRDDRRSDTGDVPGWVMVVVMTAGLVVALVALAGPALNDAFTNAISSVTKS